MEDGYVCVIDLFCMVCLNVYYNKIKLFKGRRDFDYMIFVDYMVLYYIIFLENICF